MEKHEPSERCLLMARNLNLICRTSGTTAEALRKIRETYPFDLVEVVTNLSEYLNLQKRENMQWKNANS
jgi:hypothetical protein